MVEVGVEVVGVVTGSKEIFKLEVDVKTGKEIGLLIALILIMVITGIVAEDPTTTITIGVTTMKEDQIMAIIMAIIILDVGDSKVMVEEVVQVVGEVEEVGEDVRVVEDNQTEIDMINDL